MNWPIIRYEVLPRTGHDWPQDLSPGSIREKFPVPVGGQNRILAGDNVTSFRVVYVVAFVSPPPLPQGGLVMVQEDCMLGFGDGLALRSLH